jgi:hypothetical protein
LYLLWELLFVAVALWEVLLLSAVLWQVLCVVVVVPLEVLWAMVAVVDERICRERRIGWKRTRKARWLQMFSKEISLLLRLLQ